MTEIRTDRDDDRTMSIAAAPTDLLDDMPNSSTLVWVALHEIGPAHRDELAEYLCMSRYTVDYATRQLLDAGHIDWTSHPDDGRKRRYYIPDRQ